LAFAEKQDMSSPSSLSATHRSERAAAPLLEGHAQKRARVSARCARQLVFVLLLILFGAISAVAMPLAEYRSRIHQAIAELESLKEIRRGERAQEHADRSMRSFNAVLQLVPLEKQVEWGDARVLVNNTWLEDEFQNFQQVSRTDPQSAEILSRITERLRALEDRLTELESQNNGAEAAQGKDQEKARLKEILSRSEFAEKPPPQESIIKRTWDRFVNWLKSLLPGSNELEPGRMSWFSFIAMILIFALVAGVLGYVISKLIPFFQRRRAKLKLGKPEARIVLGERLAPDQGAADLLAEAEALARKGDLRAAIRKAYIALLCELGDRKVLTLAQHKTNHDYLRAMREQRPLLAEMQKLTNSFEDHWYGFRQTTADDWTNFRSGYEKVIRTE
jgi:hypothetical protein